MDELELAQLSANNRQELARMRAEVYKKRHEKIDVQLQALRNNLNAQRQREAEQALEKPSSWPSRTAICQKASANSCRSTANCPPR